MKPKAPFKHSALMRFEARRQTASGLHAQSIVLASRKLSQFRVTPSDSNNVIKSKLRLQFTGIWFISEI